MSKYARLRDQLSDTESARILIHDPPRATYVELRRVHTDAYLRAFTTGALESAAQRRMGFPWSSGLVERSARATGGTIAAARAALEFGVAMNLAGGTHHAFADRGEGFCAYNDVAVAVRALQHEKRAARVLIVDLDVHQGNGTHAIFADDPAVFTFSMHGRRNYPFHKVDGDLDIALDDGVEDEPYLQRLAESLPRVLATHMPDIAMYLAGADPLASDRLGRLAVTHDGLARRDAFVLETCRAIGVPVAITIAGGYARDIDDTVRAHVHTARIAAEFA